MFTPTLCKIAALYAIASVTSVLYAKSLYTIVDGTVYFDREKDAERSKQVTAERTKLIQKMLGDKRAGMPTRPATPTTQILLECGDHDHNEGLNTIYETQKK